jgi:hypothetical protein
MAANAGGILLAAALLLTLSAITSRHADVAAKSSSPT